MYRNEAKIYDVVPSYYWCNGSERKRTFKAGGWSTIGLSLYIAGLNGWGGGGGGGGGGGEL